MGPAVNHQIIEDVRLPLSEPFFWQVRCVCGCTFSERERLAARARHAEHARQFCAWCGRMFDLPPATPLARPVDASGQIMHAGCATDFEEARHA